MRGYLRAFFWGTGLSGAFFGAALAADMPVKARAPVAAPAAPGLLVFGGVAGDHAGWFSDAGFVAAFNGNLQQDGWLIRGRGGFGNYHYNRTTTLQQSVNYQVGEIMLGYQIFSGVTRYTVYAGGNIENHDNNDPLAEVTGTKGGFKAQAEAYSEWSPSWYTLLLGTYSTAFDSYFTLAKLGYKLNNTISFGPEFTAHGNDRYDAVRTGPFVGFDLTSTTQLVVSGGYSWDTRRDNLNDQSGAYGTLHLRSLF